MLLKTVFKFTTKIHFCHSPPYKYNKRPPVLWHTSLPMPVLTGCSSCHPVTSTPLLAVYLSVLWWVNIKGHIFHTYFGGRYVRRKTTAKAHYPAFTEVISGHAKENIKIPGFKGKIKLSAVVFSFHSRLVQIANAILENTCGKAERRFPNVLIVAACRM